MTTKSVLRKIFGKFDPVSSLRGAGQPAFKATEGVWLDMYYSGHTDHGVFWYYEKLRSRLN